MKKFFKEFKAFISKGSIMDLAVGVVIGGAFTAIITAMVQGILMPIITLAVPGGIEGFVTVLNPQEATATADTVNVISYYGVNYNADIVNVIKWGTFINAVIYFLIVAFILFVILKVVKYLEKKAKALEAKLQPEEEAPAPAPAPAPVIPEDILLLREIRDSLKKEKK